VSSNGTSGLSSDELRAAVRAVLREVLPDGLPQGGTTVAVTSDADLDTLVRRVAEQCEDPATRAAYREGRHGFRLAEIAGRARRDHDEGSRHARPAGDTLRVERGAVAERAVLKAAKNGSRLVLGPKAVLTPLARDRARVLGVEIEKES
jgi:hypothetical protein